MIKFIFCISCIFLNSIVFAQKNSLQLQVDSLKYIAPNNLDCNPVFWRIVAKRKDIIPYLLNKILDTTLTAVDFKCKAKKMRVGDFAYYAFDRIVQVPLSYLTGLQFDVISDGCLGEYNYLENNRSEFYRQLKEWYEKDMSKLIWIDDTQKNITDCKRRYGITGYYSLP